MSLIVDPDGLNQNVEIIINKTAFTITLVVTGNLSNDGVTGAAVYSFLKEEWKNDNTLRAYPFPMLAIDSDAGKFAIGRNDSGFNSWKWGNETTRTLLRSIGWQEFNSSGTLLREYIGVFSGDGIQSSSQAYFYFENDTSASNFVFTGPVNEGVQTYGDASNGNFDKRNEVLTIAVRTQGFTYDQISSTALPQLSTGLKPIFAPLTLNESLDADISASDSTISTTAPYTGMGITFRSTPVASNTLYTSDLASGPYNFGITIDANNGTKQQVYEFVQYSLRQTTNIDADATGSSKPGKLQDSLLRFVGAQLQSLNTTNADGGGTGVAIINFQSTDINDLQFNDNTSTARVFPFVSSGTISFNTNLVNDPDSVFTTFFTFTTRNAVSDLAISNVLGSNASIDSAGGNLPTLSQNDYIRITGSSYANNNGIWEVTDASPTSSQFDATKPDGLTIANTSVSFAGNIDENPFGSPDSIIVQDTASANISGSISGNSSIAFDFDYDGNQQGGRTAGTDASVTLVAIGLNTAKPVSATGTITRTTGINLSLVAALELNYSNP